MAAVKASDKLELLRLLRKENCDVNADDISGWTALHSAAEHMEDDLVYLLLAFGADPSVENECRMTPYDSAVVAVASAPHFSCAVLALYYFDAAVLRREMVRSVATFYRRRARATTQPACWHSKIVWNAD